MKATLHKLCLATISHLVKNKLYETMGVSQCVHVMYFECLTKKINSKSKYSSILLFTLANSTQCSVS